MYSFAILTNANDEMKIAKVFRMELKVNFCSDKRYCKPAVDTEGCKDYSER